VANIGKWNTLRVTRETMQGFYLDADEQGEVLLPNRYVPADAKTGDSIDVFVHRDSEDRLVATTDKPLAEVGEFAALRVLNVDRQIGAFLDWGLPKDLLLPFREQVYPVTTGDMVVVYVALDPKTDRIYATTRLERHVHADPPPYSPGQPVDIIVARETPLGYIALVERSHLGLLYHSNLGSPLKIGQSMKSYVDAIRGDGKIDLKADASGYRRVITIADAVLDALKANGGRLDLDDDSSPTAIRAALGCSKKAFKQAVGALFRKRAIRFTKPGIQLTGDAADSDPRV